MQTCAHRQTHVHTSRHRHMYTQTDMYTHATELCTYRHTDTDNTETHAYKTHTHTHTCACARAHVQAWPRPHSPSHPGPLLWPKPHCCLVPGVQVRHESSAPRGPFLARLFSLGAPHSSMSKETSPVHGGGGSPSVLSLPVAESKYEKSLHYGHYCRIPATGADTGQTDLQPLPHRVASEL